MFYFFARARTAGCTRWRRLVSQVEGTPWPPPPTTTGPVPGRYRCTCSPYRIWACVCIDKPLNIALPYLISVGIIVLLHLLQGIINHIYLFRFRPFPFWQFRNILKRMNWLLQQSRPAISLVCREQSVLNRFSPIGWNRFQAGPSHCID